MRARPLGLVFAMALAPALAAQERPIELGVDASVAFGLNTPKVTTIGLPASQFRVGFYGSDRLSFEPVLSYNMIKVQDEDAIYTLGAELGVNYHFTADREKSRFFVHPLAGVSLVGGGGESESQFHVGGGAGVKVPMTSRLAFRLEAQYQHGFETDVLDKSDHIGILFGFSFFTR